MIKVTRKEFFTEDPKIVWNVMTNNQKGKWRSDCKKIEVIDEFHFVEFTNHNFPTYFTITSKEYLKEYQFDLQNSNMSGHWTGIFTTREKGGVEVEFIEEIEVNFKRMKVVAKFYLQNQQKRYIRDLKKELERIKNE